MLRNLHKNLFKYIAILGLVPYIMPRKQQKYNLKQRFKYTSCPSHEQLRHYFWRYRNDNHSRLLRWQQIYTIMLIVANLIAILCGLTFLPFGDKFIVSNLVSIIVFVVQIITLTSILLETMFTYGKYYKLINNYNGVEILFKHLLQIHLCATKIQKRLWRKYTFVLFAEYGSLIASITVIWIKTYDGYFWYALTAIVILRSRSIQITLYLDFIVYYLELFNTKLNALISCKIDKNYNILDIDYRHLESFECLRNLKTIYMEIYALHNKFNELFGNSIALIYTVVVLDIIINTYWTFLTIFEYYESYYNYITFSTLLPLFVIIITLCYTAEQCEKQCNITLVYLKRLLTTSQNVARKDECYNSLLQSFILQILRNPITITANGYFTVNLRSLMKILANIVTYLVILLQFRKSNINDELANVTQNTKNVETKNE